MAFTVPDFNLLCDVYRGATWAGRVLVQSDLPCNLAMGRRVTQYVTAPDEPQFGQAHPNLLVPAGSDLRGYGHQAGTQDMVEVPSGSGRWYAVGTVDDVGKGFSNEYRLASLAIISQYVDSARYLGLFWPLPVP